MDESLRELERRAQGDDAAALELARALVRAGRPDEARPWASGALASAPERDRLGLARACSLPLVVLPWEERFALCAVGERITVLAPLPFPTDARPWFDGEWLVGPRARGGVAIFKVEDSRITDLPILELPPAFEPHAFHREGNVLYVGGRITRDSRDGPPGEIGYACDLASAATTALAVPDEVRRYGKAIDGFFVRGSRLVAVDDIVLPKYLLVYDRTDPLRPRLLETPQLATHSTYERVTAVATKDDLVLILSSGAGRGGGASFVSFLQADVLGECCSVSARNPETGLAPWNDLALVGDRAVLAAGTEGISTFPLAAARPHLEAPTDPGSFGESRAPDLGRAIVKKVAVALAPDTTPERERRFPPTSERVLRVAAVPGRADVVAAAIGSFASRTRGGLVARVHRHALVALPRA